jgi:hypothetical protein
MATAEDFAAMLRAQQDMQRGMLEMITRISQPQGSMVDNRGIGKPFSFRGEEGKYHEWKTKLVAYLKVTNPRAPGWLRWATTQTEAVREDDLEIMFQNTDAYAELGDMKQFSTKLHAILVSITEGDAFRIVDSARDCNGLESYRLLTKRYEPKNPGTKRALLKSIINNPGVKKITDIEANLMNVERLILKYESMTDEKNHLPEDLKATIIIELCHRDLREHLELSTDQMSYNKVRTEILNYVDRKRDSMSNDIKAMEVDHLDSDYHYGDIGGKMTMSTSSSTTSRRAEKVAKEVRGKAITMVAKAAMRRAKATEKALKTEEEKADMRRAKARARAFKASALGAARGGTLPPSA